VQTEYTKPPSAAGSRAVTAAQRASTIVAAARAMLFEVVFTLHPFS
jgi:hypothetical protein